MDPAITSYTSAAGEVEGKMVVLIYRQQVVVVLVVVVVVVVVNFLLAAKTHSNTLKHLFVSLVFV